MFHNETWFLGVWAQASQDRLWVFSFFQHKRINDSKNYRLLGVLRFRSCYMFLDMFPLFIFAENQCSYYPYAPCGAHIADPWFDSLRFVAAGVASEVGKCHAELRGERLLLSVFRKFFTSSLQVFCIELFEIAFVECFATSVWYALLLLVFCKFSLCFVPCGDLLTCYARDGARIVFQTCKTEAKWVPKCTTNHTKWTFGRFGRPFGSVSISRPRKSERPRCFLIAFGRQFDDSRCHSGPNWISKGVQQSSFLDINSNKMRKIGS